jgi:ATP-dependent DNA helicase RecG
MRQKAANIAVIMNTGQLRAKLDELRKLPKETEWVEFKQNYVEHEEIGEYISALSNAACLHDKRNAYLVYGVENKTHAVVGTTFDPKHAKVGGEELENWLAHLLNPRIDFRIYRFDYDMCCIVIFEIDATKHTPVKFKNNSFIRVGSYKKKLSDYPEKERKIWKNDSGYDWSAQICDKATINDLDTDAIAKAREEYKKKNPSKAQEVDAWNDAVFLNKAKITINGRITKAAIILLGNPDADHFVSPSVIKMSWILKDGKNNDIDYEHFGPPFILNVERVLSKIRNLNYRYLPNETLFPVEITKYDPWVIREALHNCIAHQDYELKGRISVVEKPDELIFDNLGSFIPGNVEIVIQQDSPPSVYRNPFLAHAMVNLNMIDTIGGGIKKMFKTQMDRFFPLPDYDLTQAARVVVKVQGRVLDERYTRLLIKNKDLDLSTVMLLDKVQKVILLSKEEHEFLKSKKLVEGRYPNLFVAPDIAITAEERAKYIKYRAFDDKHYKEWILDLIKKFGSASRTDINNLLIEKLPDVLTVGQKRNKISNLLYAMAKKDETIRNNGSKRKPKWVLS